MFYAPILKSGGSVRSCGDTCLAGLVFFGFLSFPLFCGVFGALYHLFPVLSSFIPLRRDASSVCARGVGGSPRLRRDHAPFPAAVCASVIQDVSDLETLEPFPVGNVSLFCHPFGATYKRVILFCRFVKRKLVFPGQMGVFWILYQ